MAMAVTPGTRPATVQIIPQGTQPGLTPVAAFQLP